MAPLKLAFEALVFLAALLLPAVACLEVLAARDRRKPGAGLRDYPVPDSFPAIGSRGGTAPMDVIGAEVNQILARRNDRDA